MTAESYCTENNQCNAALWGDNEDDLVVTVTCNIEGEKILRYYENDS